MSIQKFTGILAAVVTPFTAERELDLPGIQRQVDHIIGNGVHGLVPGGSTGEFTTLTLEERKQVNAAYVEAAAGRVPVVAGAGALSTTEAIELTAHAKEIGADAVMIVPPFYGAMPFDEMVDHFAAISEAVDLPIMYYNLPEATGIELTPDQFSELARRTNVSSYKDTGGDASKFAQILLHHGDDIQALNGFDTLTFDALALGAQGGVWGAASVIPELCAEFYNVMAVDKDLVRGRELWQKIHPICAFLESYNYAAVIKLGLELVGVSAGPARLPIQPLSEEVRRDFAQLLIDAGVEVVGASELAAVSR